MKKTLRHLADRVTLQLLKRPLVDKMVGFLSYQRQRATRRRLEPALRKAGSYGDTVIQGPFAGLRYPPLEHWASCRFQKIIGTYEHELHDLVHRLAATENYDLIVNVGAAEGFYSVGLARLFPAARIITFEAKPDRALFLDKLASLNGVAERMENHGRCSAADLAALNPAGRVLVWMDIDLGEREVLDPEKVPWLSRADILVELHDCMEAGVSSLIRKRFEKSHLIEQITTAGLRYERYPVLRNLPFQAIDSLVGEDRSGLQDWFFMKPAHV